MKTRLITAAVGVPFLIFVLVVRGWFAELVIALLTIIAMRECYRALGKAGYNVCTWGGYAAAVAMWPLSRVMGVLDPLLLVVAAMGISMTGVMLREKPTFPDAAASVYPLFTCFLPMSMFMMMMNMEQLQKYPRDIQKFTMQIMLEQSMEILPRYSREKKEL